MAALCQKRKLVVHMVKYIVFFTREQARFAQIIRHIYLLLKKEKQFNLSA